MTATEITSQTIEPRSSIEITKNSKGFGWVSKTYARAEESDDELLARVEYVVTQLIERYGGES